jgi:hypothetical protein
MIHRLQWMTLRFVERLGWIGCLAAALGLFCIIFACFVLLSSQAALSVLEAQKIAPSKVIANKPMPSKMEQLQSFTQQFPPLENRTANVQKIMSLAQSMRLALDEITYKSEQRPDDALTHYHIDFNVMASYPDMRKFLSNVLVTLPNASIDALNISRENATDEVVETRVRLTLHFAS